MQSPTKAPTQPSQMSPPEASELSADDLRGAAEQIRLGVPAKKVAKPRPPSDVEEANRLAARERRNAHMLKLALDKITEDEQAISEAVTDYVGQGLRQDIDSSVFQDLTELMSTPVMETDDTPAKRELNLNSYQGNADQVSIGQVMNLRRAVARDESDAASRGLLEAVVQRFPVESRLAKVAIDLVSSRRIIKAILHTMVNARVGRKSKDDAFAASGNPITAGDKGKLMATSYRIMNTLAKQQLLFGKPNSVVNYLIPSPVIARVLVMVDGVAVRSQQREKVTALYPVSMFGTSVTFTDYLTNHSGSNLNHNPASRLRLAEQVLHFARQMYVGKGDVVAQLLRLNSVYEIAAEVSLQAQRNPGAMSQDSSYVTAKSYWQDFIGLGTSPKARISDFMTDIMDESGKVHPIEDWPKLWSDREEFDSDEVQVPGDATPVQGSDTKFERFRSRYSMNVINLTGQAGPGFGSLSKEKVLPLAIFEANRMLTICAESATAAEAKALVKVEMPFIDASYLKPKDEVQKLIHPIDPNLSTEANVIQNLYQEKARTIYVPCFTAVLPAFYLMSIFAHKQLSVWDEYREKKAGGKAVSSRLMGIMITLAKFNPNAGNMDILTNRVQGVGDFKGCADSTIMIYSDNAYVHGTSYENSIPAGTQVEYFPGVTPSVKKHIEKFKKIPDGTRIWVSLDGKRFESSTTTAAADANLRATAEQMGLTQQMKRYMNGILSRACSGGIGILGELSVQMPYNASGSPMTYLNNDMTMYGLFNEIFPGRVNKKMLFDLDDWSKEMDDDDPDENPDMSALAFDISIDDILQVARERGVTLTVERITILPPRGEPLFNRSQTGTVVNIDMLGYGVTAITSEEDDAINGVKIIGVLEKERVLKSIAFSKPEDDRESKMPPAELAASKSLSLIYSGAMFYSEMQDFLINSLINGRNVFKSSFQEEGEISPIERQFYYDTLSELHMERTLVERGESTKSNYTRMQQQFERDVAVKVRNVQTGGDGTPTFGLYVSPFPGRLTLPKDRDMTAAKELLLKANQSTSGNFSDTDPSWIAAVNASVALQKEVKTNGKLKMNPSFELGNVVQRKTLIPEDESVQALERVVAETQRSLRGLFSKKVPDEVITLAIRYLIARDPGSYIRDWEAIIAKRADELAALQLKNSAERAERQEKMDAKIAETRKAAKEAKAAAKLQRVEKAKPKMGRMKPLADSVPGREKQTRLEIVRLVIDKGGLSFEDKSHAIEAAPALADVLGRTSGDRVDQSLVRFFSAKSLQAPYKYLALLIKGMPPPVVALLQASYAVFTSPPIDVHPANTERQKEQQIQKSYSPYGHTVLETALQKSLFDRILLMPPRGPPPDGGGGGGTVVIRSAEPALLKKPIDTATDATKWLVAWQRFLWSSLASELSEHDRLAILLPDGYYVLSKMLRLDHDQKLLTLLSPEIWWVLLNGLTQRLPNGLTVKK